LSTCPIMTYLLLVKEEHRDERLYGENTEG
jgi:hypothetical protein